MTDSPQVWWLTHASSILTCTLAKISNHTMGVHLKSEATATLSLRRHLQLSDTYLSSVPNDSITYTHPDRKLGILCMKYFAGLGGVNRLLNEASQPEFIMKISEEGENYCNLTCRPSRHIYKHVPTLSLPYKHRHTHTQSKHILHILASWHEVYISFHCSALLFSKKKLNQVTQVVKKNKYAEKNVRFFDNFDTDIKRSTVSCC